MTRSDFRRFALAAVATPLALGLASCGETDTASGSVSGEPIAAIAAPEGKSWSEMVEKTPEGGYRMGNPDAPIKLVEFASLTCSHCAAFAAESSAELKQDFVDSGRVSVEFHNFVANPLDLTIAMLTRCGQPGAFFALTEQALANQNAILEKWSQAGEAQASQAASQPPEKRYQAFAAIAGLTDFFAARGISTEQGSACLADAQGAEALVATTSAQSKEFEITGTPAFLLNGQKANVNTWSEIKAQLENLGAR